MQGEKREKEPLLVSFLCVFVPKPVVPLFATVFFPHLNSQGAKKKSPLFLSSFFSFILDGDDLLPATLSRSSLFFLLGSLRSVISLQDFCLSSEMADIAWETERVKEKKK